MLFQLRLTRNLLPLYAPIFHSPLTVSPAELQFSLDCPMN